MFEDLTENIKNSIVGFKLPPELRQKFEEFLSNMGASTRKTVAVSFSQNVGVEMIEIDNIAGVTTKYAVKKIEYDPVNRRMDSYSDFADALTQLFEEFEISTNSNVILSLPNIYFGLIEVPGILHGDAVRNVILSDVEQSYIFKSNDPIISWCSLTKGKKDKNKPNPIVYSAIQKEVIDGILEACQNVGCRFLTIENSHLSILRGLSFLDLMRDQVKENLIWQMLLVEANNFSIMTMQGTTPIKYFEEPLAMKSFQEDEIYNVIASSSTEILNDDKIKSTSLMVISETDFVSAEVLKNTLEVNQPIDFLECNKYSQLTLYPISYEIPPEMAEQIKISAIGAAAFLFHKFPISLNYIKETVEERNNIDDQIGNIKVNLGNLELNVTKDTIRRLSLILAGVMLLPLFLIYTILGQWLLPQEQQKSNELAANIEAINKQVNDLTQTNQQAHFDINTIAKKNVEQNKKLLFKYSALEEVIPKDLWVTYSEENNSGFIVSGVASSTSAVHEFYKNLKAIDKQSTLILRKLEYASGSLDTYASPTVAAANTKYNFEIVSSKDMFKTNGVKSSFSLTRLEEDIPAEGTVSPSGRLTVSAPPQSREISYEEGADMAKQLGQQAAQQIGGGQGNLPPNLKKIEKF